MKYRTLGKTGLNVSVIGLGTWQLGGEWGKSFSQVEVDQIVGAAKEVGINFIDTAECYGDHLSETLVGKAIQNNRKDWILATKFGHQFDGHLKRISHWQPKQILKQLDSSLKALRTDYIDIYQMHSGPDDAFHQDEIWNILNQQVKAGKIGHLGNSISNDSLHQAKSSEKYGISVVQVVYNRLDQMAEESVFPFAQKQGLGVLARVPLASGFLSGKYKADVAFAKNDVRSRHDEKFISDRLTKVEEIRKTEIPVGTNMAEWALAWCLSNKTVTAVIPGCKNLEQVRSNAKAADQYTNK